MMLNHWYFCSCVKLSPDETADFLDILSILEERYPAQQQLEALQKLNGLDSLRRSYALPSVVSLLFSNESRQRMQDQDPLYVGKLMQACKQSILSLFASKVSSQNTLSMYGSRSCPVTQIVHKLDKLTAEDVSVLLKYPLRNTKIRRSDVVSSYLESDEFNVEILFLSLLHVIGEYDINLLEDIDSEDLMSAALSGACGELPFQLALGITFRTIRYRRDLLKLLPADWIVRPYCIQLMLRQLIYAEQQYDKEQGRKEPDALRWESRQLVHFSNCYEWCKRSLHQIWIDRELDQDEKYRVCAMLWQAVALDMAFTADPKGTLNTLNGYWLSPAYGYVNWRDLPEECNDIQKSIIHRNGNRVKHEDPEHAKHLLSHALCSPWQKHETPKEGIIFSEFPRMTIPFNALRSFAAAILLQRVLIYSQFVSTGARLTSFYRVMMNLCHCLTCKDAQQELHGENPLGVWSKAMRGLAAFAERSIRNMGTGSVFIHVPKNLMNALSSNKEYKSKMLNNLMSRYSFLVCAHWASSSIRASSEVLPQFGTSWLRIQKRHTETSAHELCSLLFRNHFEDAVHSTDALELLCQCYLEELDDSEYWSGSSWLEDYQMWAETGICQGSPITVSQVLLSRPLAMEDWNGISLSRKDFFTAEAWSVVHTMRMRALMHTPGVQNGQYPIRLWFSQWNESIAELNTIDVTRNPVLLYLLCDLLRPMGEGMPCSELDDHTEKVCSLVLDMIYNALPDGFVICVDRANRYLRQNKAQFPYTEKTLSAVQRLNLRRLIDIQETVQVAEPMLYRFIADCAARFQSSDIPGAGEALSDCWRGRGINKNGIRTRTITQNTWNPLTDRFLIHTADNIVVGQPVQNLQRNFHSNAIANGFAEPLQKKGNQQMLGIVVERLDNGLDVRYRVNAGTGTLVEAGTEIHARFSPGDFVCVTERVEQEYPYRHRYFISSMAWACGDENEVVEVKKINFRITPQKSWLNMQMPNLSQRNLECGIGMGKCSKERFHEILDLWCPNIDCYFAGSYEFSGKSYEAVFDRHLESYIPVTRSFSRLLMEKVLCCGNEDRTARLTLIRSEGDGYIFSAEPGHNYYLRNENWVPGVLEQLVDDVAHEGLVPGLIINARMREYHNMPCLEPVWEDPVDRINLEWASLFDEESAYVLQRHPKDGSYSLQIEFCGQTHVIRGWFEEGGISRNAVGAYNVQLASNGWNRCSQRERVIRCTPLRAYSLDNNCRTAEEIRRIINLCPGDNLTITDVLAFRNSDGYQRIRLNNNMLVYCAPESLSMTNSPLGTQCRFRECIVENVYVQNTAVSVAEADTIELPALDTDSNVVKGVVAQFVRTADSNPGVVHCVWFEENGRLFEECHIPHSVFQIAPWSSGAVVVATRQEDGRWSITCENRNIFVRALWQVEDHTQDTNAVVRGIPLARDVKVPGYNYCLVSQDTNRPVLHLWNNETELLEETLLCGLHSDQGIVGRSNRRYSSGYVFPYAKRTDVVHLRQGNTEFWGESEMGEFSQSANAWTAELVLQTPVVHNRDDYFDVRRVFHRSAEKRQDRDDSERTLRMATIIEAYREWLEEEQFPHHVQGTIRNHKLVIDALKVPARFDCDGVDDRWIDDVDFLPDGDKPWITQSPEHRYSNRVRALLKLQGNVWYATSREAQPYRMDKVLAAYFRAVSGHTINQHLYYAGPDEDQYLRFEWGLGFCFLVRPEDVVDSFGNQIGMNLFYGDRIVGFKMLQGEGEFGWKLCIASDAILRGLPWQIWNDSTENNMLQMLKIHISRKTGKVAISEVTVSENSIHNNTRGCEAWRFRAFYNGMLDHESIQRLLNEPGEEEENRMILAKLVDTGDQKTIRHLRFSYLPMGEDLDTEALLGKNVCLVAGSIRENQKNKWYLPSNDYSLMFYMPDCLPQGNEEEPQNADALVVSVRRRSFSLDESKLRVLYNENHTDEYRGNNMLVKLFRAPGAHQREWSGSVVEAPVRSSSCLKDWLRNMPLGIVVLGKPDKGMVPLEVAPGIVCKISEEAVSGEIQEGATAIVRLENDEIWAQINMPSDRRYIPAEGRPAELLPKDGVIARFADIQRRRYFSDSENVSNLPDAESIEGNHFTVAGFPQIQIRNPWILEPVLCSEPPRITWVNPGLNDLYQGGRQFYRAVRLEVRGSIPAPFYKYLPPADRVETEQSEWHRISYRDDVPKAISTALLAGRWHYHDKETAVCKSGSNYVQKWILQRKADYRETVFFLNDDRNLRIQPSELLRYGYSAREINEYGLPRKNEWYPVAHSDKESIWIELMPGRLVELPWKALFRYHRKAEKRYPLENLYCGALAAGDLIRLDESQSYVGGQRQIMVSGIRFGIRSAFGTQRNYLPVISGVPESHVCLGSGRRSMIYPTTDTQSWADKSLVGIDEKNRLVPLMGDNPFNAGDTVMVALNKDGVVRICGFDRPHHVQIDYEDKWNNAAWVSAAMRSRPSRIALFKAMGGSMTVRVQWSAMDTRTNAEQPLLKVCIAAKFNDLDALPEGTILVGECIGMLEKGDCYLLVQAGNTLLRISPEQLISGIPIDARSTAAETLVRNRQLLWMHKTKDGWNGGLPDNSVNTQRDVRLVASIALERTAPHMPVYDGFICQTESNCRLYWLPLKAASRTNADIASLWDVLQSRPIRTAQLMENGTVSLIDTSESKLRFAQLKRFPAKYRALIHRQLEHKYDGTLRYLAEMYPVGDLIYLDSEMPLTVSADDPVPVELIEIFSQNVTAILYGTHLTFQRVPEWINQKIVKNSAINCTRVEPHPIFESYYSSIRQADRSVRTGRLQPYPHRIRPDLALNIRICYLAALLAQQNRPFCRLTPEQIESAEAEARIQLSRWLDSYGYFIACCFDTRKREHYFMDLTPVVSAIILLHLLRFDQNPELKQIAQVTAVHLTRVIGLACDSSLHIEVLLRDWLLWKDAPRYSAWRKLSGVDLQGQARPNDPNRNATRRLSQEQCRLLKKVCNDISHNHYSGVDKKLKLVADALLYSIGELKDFRLFGESFREEENKYYTNQLAIIGHVLTPPATAQSAAIDRLTDSMFKKLFEIQSSNVPLCVMTDKPLPMPKDQLGIIYRDFRKLQAGLRCYLSDP